jgi:hypothetical protein
MRVAAMPGEFVRAGGVLLELRLADNMSPVLPGPVITDCVSAFDVGEDKPQCGKFQTIGVVRSY